MRRYLLDTNMAGDLIEKRGKVEKLWNQSLVLRPVNPLLNRLATIDGTC